jgi:hypothetical protein
MEGRCLDPMQTHVEQLAAISEIRAMADYNIAVARYHQATGTTLTRHGITLAE